MTYPCKLILFIMVATWVFPISKGFAAEPVLICGEPWAPFLYESVDENTHSKKIVGFHLQNFRSLSEVTGLEFKFTLLPWKRCLDDIENFSQSGDPEIAIDATFNEERAEKYHLVGPIYDISTAVWYSRKRFPNGPLSKQSGQLITWINEMQDHSICGALGWNYDMYYTEHDIPRTNQVIRTPAGLQGMFGMLSKGRCDLVETHPSLVVGALISGELEMPKDIACNKMSEVPEEFYMMVSKNSPRAEDLVTRLSTALIYLKRTQQWKSIKDKGALPDSAAIDAFRECL